MTLMKTVLLIGLGSGLGGMLRFLAGGWIQRAWPQHLPVGTIAVNVTGCLIIGLLAGLLRKGGEPVLNGDAREFLLSGLLGGYTTFSAFSLQSLVLAREGMGGTAVINVAVSLVLCLGAVWIGFALARVFGPV